MKQKNKMNDTNIKKDENIKKDANRNYLRKLIKDPHVQEMKRYIQHGKVTTYEHCVSVTKACDRLNRRLHLGADERTLLTGAILHDFYLYDWHGRSLKDWTHSYKHPIIACQNAVTYFDVDEDVQHMIRCHMWPFTFWRIPRSREAWILVIADKYCSLKETLFCR